LSALKTVFLNTSVLYSLFIREAHVKTWCYVFQGYSQCVDLFIEESQKVRDISLVMLFKK